MGELLLEARRGSEHEAEDHFRQAIQIARYQESKSFELCATNSLARMHARRSARDARRNLLLVHRRLRHRRPADAKALLDELDG